MAVNTRPGIRSRLAKWLGPTAAPPQWNLVIHALLGMAAGAALGMWLAPTKGAILAGLTGALVAAVGVSGPPRLEMRLASFAAIVAVLGTGLAFVTAGHPVLAALAMAAVAVLTSVGAGTGPIGAAIGAVASLAYVLAVVLTTLVGLVPDVSVPSGLSRIVLGCLGGLLVTWAAAALRARRSPAGTLDTPRLPPPWPAMARSRLAFDQYARDGVRRAIPLAIGVYLLEASGSRDAVWVFMSAFVVLQPTGKTPLALALGRVAATVVGVVLLGLLALAVPYQFLFAVAVGLMFLGVVYQRRYPLVAGGLTAMGAILLVGAPSGAIGSWATHRLFDTLLGCGLALAATYLLWPSDQPDTGLTASAASGPSA